MYLVKPIHSTHDIIGNNVLLNTTFEVHKLIKSLEQIYLSHDINAKRGGLLKHSNRTYTGFVNALLKT